MVIMVTSGPETHESFVISQLKTEVQESVSGYPSLPKLIIVDTF